MTDFAELKLFITGPTLVREEIRKGGLLPEFGHRDAENDKRFEPIRRHLQALAGVPVGSDEYEPVIYTGSGSTAMESSIRSLVGDDEVVLNVSVGAFGDLYHKMAVANGKKAVQLKLDYGQAIDLAALEQSLKEHAPKVVTFTHNETSTGVTNDIASVCELVRKYDALPLVDGVSIFGGADIGLMKAKPTMYSTATQKCLALPAGFGIAFISPEALAKAETVSTRGHAMDILVQIARARKNQTVSTPNCTLANQMAVQMDHIVNTEGIENRFKRHLEMRDMAHDFVNQLDGYELFAPEGFRSPTVTTARAPQGVTAAMLKQAKETLRGKGYLMDPGYGKLNVLLEEQGRPPVFRIGHMGDIMPDMLAEYLADLKETLLSL